MSDTFTIKQNDTRPKIRVQLAETGEGALDLTTAEKVYFLMRAKADADPTSPKVKGECAFVNKSEGKVEYTWEEGDTDTIGEFKAEWEIHYEDGGIETVPNDGYVIVNVEDDLG